jgi:hypothetical protein
MKESQKRYINEKEVSKMTGRALQTLRNNRFTKRIPFEPAFACL